MRYMENFYLLAVISVLYWLTPTFSLPPSTQRKHAKYKQKHFYIWWLAQLNTAGVMTVGKIHEDGLGWQGVDAGSPANWLWHFSMLLFDVLSSLAQFASPPCRQQSQLGREGCLSVAGWTCANTPLAKAWPSRQALKIPSGLGEMVREICWGISVSQPSTLGCWLRYLSKTVAYQGDLRDLYCFLRIEHS